MTKKKTRPSCSSFHAFREWMLFRAACAKVGQQIDLEMLQRLDPTVDNFFAKALSKEDATEEDARAFVTDLCAMNYPMPLGPTTAPATTAPARKLLTDPACEYLVECLWTRSWKVQCSPVSPFSTQLSARVDGLAHTILLIFCQCTDMLSANVKSKCRRNSRRGVFTTRLSMMLRSLQRRA